MIRISVVSYLNSYPFHYGLQFSPFRLNATLLKHNPAECAKNIENGKADIGLIPVGALSDHHSIVSSYGIASFKHVRSVLLLSKVPITEISTVLMDDESRSSNLLTRVLFKHLWNRAVEFTSDLLQEENVSAKVCIGDKALKEHLDWSYRYDLAEAWYNLTGWPFVFAVWAVKKEFNNDNRMELSGFEDSLKWGVSKIKESIMHFGTSGLSMEEAVAYLNNNIQYELDSRCFQSISLFRAFAKEITV